MSTSEEASPSSWKQLQEQQQQGGSKKSIHSQTQQQQQIQPYVRLSYLPLPPSKAESLLEKPRSSGVSGAASCGMPLHELYVVLSRKNPMHNSAAAAAAAAPMTSSPGGGTSSSSSSSSSSAMSQIYATLVPISIRAAFFDTSSSSSSSSSSINNTQQEKGGGSNSNSNSNSKSSSATTSTGATSTTTTSTTTATAKGGGGGGGGKVRHHTLANDPQLRPKIQQSLQLEKMLRDKLGLISPEERLLVQFRVKKQLVDTFCPRCGTVYTPSHASGNGMRCRSCPTCPICTSAMHVAMFGEVVGGTGPKAYRFVCSACHWQTKSFPNVIPELSSMYLPAQRAKVKLLPYATAIHFVLKNLGTFSTSMLLRKMMGVGAGSPGIGGSASNRTGSSSTLQSQQQQFAELTMRFKEMWAQRYPGRPLRKSKKASMMAELLQAAAANSSPTKSGSSSPEKSGNVAAAAASSSNIVRSIAFLEEKLALAEDIIFFPDDEFAATGGSIGSGGGGGGGGDTSVAGCGRSTSPPSTMDPSSLSGVSSSANTTPTTGKVGNLPGIAASDFWTCFKLGTVIGAAAKDGKVDPRAPRNSPLVFASPPRSRVHQPDGTAGGPKSHNIGPIETAKAQLCLGNLESLLAQRGVKLPQGPTGGGSSASPTGGGAATTASSPPKDGGAGSPTSKAGSMWEKLKVASPFRKKDEGSKFEGASSSNSLDQAAGGGGSGGAAGPSASSAEIPSLVPQIPKDAALVMDGALLTQRYSVVGLSAGLPRSAVANANLTGPAFLIENKVLYQPAPAIRLGPGMLEMPFRTKDVSIKVGSPGGSNAATSTTTTTTATTSTASSSDSGGGAKGKADNTTAISSSDTSSILQATSFNARHVLPHISPLHNLTTAMMSSGSSSSSSSSGSPSPPLFKHIVSSELIKGITTIQKIEEEAEKKKKESEKKKTKEAAAAASSGQQQGDDSTTTTAKAQEHNSGSQQEELEKKKETEKAAAAAATLVSAPDAWVHQYFCLTNMTGQNVEVIALRLVEWRNVHVAPHFIGAGYELGYPQHFGPGSPRSASSPRTARSSSPRKDQDDLQPLPIIRPRTALGPTFSIASTISSSSTASPSQKERAQAHAAKFSTCTLAAFQSKEAPTMYYVSEQHVAALTETYKQLQQHQQQQNSSGSGSDGSPTSPTTTSSFVDSIHVVQDHASRIVFGIALSPSHTPSQVKELVDSSALEPRCTIEVEVKVRLPIPQVAENSAGAAAGGTTSDGSGGGSINPEGGTAGGGGLTRTASRAGGGALKKEATMSSTTTTATHSAPADAPPPPPTVEKSVRLTYYCEVRLSA